VVFALWLVLLWVLVLALVQHHLLVLRLALRLLSRVSKLHLRALFRVLRQLRLAYLSPAQPLVHQLPLGHLHHPAVYLRG
jgi:hypothetical protein